MDGHWLSCFIVEKFYKKSGKGLLQSGGIRLTKKTGMNNQNLKYRNRGLLLRLLCTHDGISRIQLAQRTGLTKMTVSNIIAGLMEQGYVIECAPERNAGVGRNPITLDIAPNAPKILGVQLGREGVTAVLFDLKLRILKKEEEVFGQEDTPSILQKLFRAVDRIRLQEERILGCGVSVVGPLDVESGMVLNPPQLFWGLQSSAAPFAGRTYRTAGGVEQRHELRGFGRKVVWSRKGVPQFPLCGPFHGHWLRHH